MFDKHIYVQRRKALKQKLGEGVVLLLGNKESSMNYKDNWYPFRQDSSFLYFIGIDKPNLAAIIDVDNNGEILFGNDPTIDDLIWNGRQPSLRDQADGVGITSAQAEDLLYSFIENAISSKRTIHFLPPYRPEHFLQLGSLLNIPTTILGEKASVDLIQAIVALRSIKSSEEIAEIETAVNVTNKMQEAAIKSARLGMKESDIAGLLQSIAISNGGNLSFPTILTSRGEILHNHYTNKTLPKDALVLCDCGAETTTHYAGDLTRTFPVNGRFSNQQKEIYEIVLFAQEAAINALAPSRLFLDVHLTACEELAKGLCSIGLMKGDPKEAVALGAHTLFFQCGLGHMMGLDVHDMENLGEQYVGYDETVKKSTAFGLKSLRLGKALQDGFVLTVEPGLYFIPELIEMWAAEKKHAAFINYEKLEAYKQFGGIRIEDDFQITSGGHGLLGNGLVKTVSEIEALCAS